MRARQSGLSMVGFILVAILVAIVAMLGMKVAPAFIEYYTIVKNVNAVIKSGDAKGGSPADYRRAFEKRSMIDMMESITPADLEIVRDGDRIRISFAYSRKIHLIGVASLVLDFEDSVSGAN